MLRPASRTFNEVCDAADRDHRDNEGQGNEPHPLFPDKAANTAAFGATHLFMSCLRTPGEEVCADNEEECDHLGAHASGVQFTDSCREHARGVRTESIASSPDSLSCLGRAAPSNAQAGAAE